MGAGDIDFKATGNSAGVIQEFKKAQREVDRIDAKLDKLGKQSKKTGKAGKNMGQTMRGQFTSMVAGAVSVTAALAAVKSALQAVNEEKKRGAEGIKTAAMSRGALLQLAGGDEREFKRMTKASKATAIETGMSVPTAQELQFTLESLGLGGKRKMFAGMHGIADPKALAEGVGTLQSALGKEETGDARALLNKLFAASAVSKTTVGQFAPAASTAAATISEIEVSDEEFLASLAHLSKAAKSAEVAATQIDAFAKTVMKKGLGGRGLLGAAHEMKKEVSGMTQGELITYFGRIEGFKGYSAMMRLEKDIKKTEGVIRKEQARSGKGGEADLISAMHYMHERDPQLKAEKLTRQTKVALQITEMETKGVEQLEYERSQAFYKMASQQAGESPFTRWLTSQYMAAKHTIEGETFAEDFGPMSTERIKTVLNNEHTQAVRENTDALKEKGMNYPLTNPHIGDAN